MNRLDDLRRDFDELAKSRCMVQPQEQQEGEEYPDFVQELIGKMLPPARSGIYFSRMDLKALGMECGQRIIPRERKRMLGDILKAVDSKESLQKCLDLFSRHIDAKIAIYQELALAFPRSAPWFSRIIKKAEALKKVFERILEEWK